MQTIFKEFYAEVKKVDPTTYVNSAKSSLGSLSSTLEKRRERLKQMKADAMNLDKEVASDKTKAPKKPDDAGTEQINTAKD